MSWTLVGIGVGLVLGHLLRIWWMEREFFRGQVDRIKAMERGLEKRRRWVRAIESSTYEAKT